MLALAVGIVATGCFPPTPGLNRGPFVLDTVLPGGDVLPPAAKRSIFNLIVDVVGQGAVDPSSGEYETEAEVALIPSPDSGWKFSRWTGDAGGADNPLLLSIDADKSVQAVFEEIQKVNLTISTQGEGSVTPTSATFDEGAEIILLALPSEGWIFEGWSGDAVEIVNPLVIVMDADKALVADFKPVPSSELPLSVAIASPTPGVATQLATIDVSGSATGAAAVAVNGLAAPIDSEGNFLAQGVPLVEGTNALVATATNEAGASASDTVSIRRDTLPPLVVFESPRNGDRLISETIAVAGTVNDIIPGATVNVDDVTVSINGIPSAVNNRTFFLADIPLALGSNTLTATATDRAGNVRSTSIDVSREPDLAGVKLQIVGGNGQRDQINGLLPSPLVVRVNNADGTPAAGRPLVFDVSRGDGLLGDSSMNLRSLTLLADGNGEAQTTFSLGSRTGEGFHRVRVTTPGSLTFAEFCATAEPGTPSNIAVVMAPRAQWLVGRPLGSPIGAIVTDGHGNTVNNVEVTFRVVGGGGNIDSEGETTALTNPDGIAETAWTMGPEPGAANNEVIASFDGNPGFPASFVVSGVIGGPVENTRISGIVQDSSGLAIPGVSTVVRGTNLQATSGSDGRFIIAGVPPGGHHVTILGSSANDPDAGIFFPDIEFAIDALSGIDNHLDQIVILPFLDMAGAELAGGDEDVVLTMAGVPGFAIKVFARSTFRRDSDTGALVQQPVEMSSSQVKFDKIPMPPPQGSTPLVVGTLQPSGVILDPPAEVTYPNVEGLAPGDVADIFAFHHDIGQFVNIGPGTVSDNGSVVTSDPGFGIVQSGWHCLIRIPGETSDCANNCRASWEWRITANGSATGSNSAVVVCATKDAFKQQQATVSVSFQPAGGSVDPLAAWSVENTALIEIVDSNNAGGMSEITFTPKAGGATKLLSPPYVVTPDDGKPDIICQAEIPLHVLTVDFASAETGANSDVFLPAFEIKDGKKAAPIDKFRFLVGGGRTIKMRVQGASAVPGPLTYKITPETGVPANPPTGTITTDIITLTPQATNANRAITTTARPPVKYKIEILNAAGKMICDEILAQDLIDRSRQEYVDWAMILSNGFLRGSVGLVDNAPPRSEMKIAPSNELGGPVVIDRNDPDSCRDGPMPNYFDEQNVSPFAVVKKGIIWDQGFVDLFNDLKSVMGARLCLHSGHRGPSHNKRSRGVTNSDHQWGRAVDMSFSGPRSISTINAEFHAKLYRAGLSMTGGQVILEEGPSARLPIRWNPPPATHVFDSGGQLNAKITVQDRDGDTLPDTVSTVEAAVLPPPGRPYPDVPIGTVLPWDGGVSDKPSFRIEDKNGNNIIDPGEPLILIHKGQHTLKERFGGATHVHVEAN